MGFILKAFALVLFIIAFFIGYFVPDIKLNLIAAGLAFWVGSDMMV